MNDSTLHPLARDYLKRLKKAARRLPRARRKELLAEIESHLSEALPAGASEAEALNVLERLGEPAEIVAEAGAGHAAETRAGLKEWLAIPLLLIGGVVIPVLGWFVGVVLLWSSRIWTLRDKLIGTLVIPGGLAAAIFLVLGVGGSTSGGGCSSSTTTTVGRHGVKAVDASSVCTSSGGGVNYLALALLVVLVALPVFTSIHLGRRTTRFEIETP
jgi:uncharacterized membrane protein